MEKLKVPDLSYCYRLESLPDNLGKGLAGLEYLSTNRCGSLKTLPESIGELTSLIELDISHTLIEELPRSIGELRNLKAVKMWDTKISKIPEEFWKIGKLEKVQAVGRVGRLHGNISGSIYENKSLSILKLREAVINELPPLPESLTILHLDKLCVETFPDIKNLTHLKELDLTFARPGDGGKLNGLGEDWIPRWIVDLTKLESLRLDFDYMVTVSTDLSLPPHLKSLNLRCPNLRRLRRLPSSLSSVRLEQCYLLRSMEDLSNLKNLSSLSLRQCYSLRSMDLSGLKKLSSLKIVNSGIAEIQGLGCLENLRDLSLDNLERLKVLLDLRNSNKLRWLHVLNCDNLVEIEGELPLSLDKLSIFACPSLVKLPDLSNFVGKHVIWIHECEKLNVDAILAIARNYPGVLHIEGFQQLQFLPDLSDLTNSSEITSLQVRRCGDLAEIRGKLPESLEKLGIYDCKSLRELPDLSSSTRLREVSIGHCDDLGEIQGKLPGPLEKLKISSWRSLRKLPNMSSLMRLEEVSIYRCGNLIEIGGELPQSLKILKIRSCGSLQEFPNLSSLTGLQEFSLVLREFSLGECGNLVEIQGELPESLEILEIRSCGSLQKFPDLSSLTGLREVCMVRCGNLVEIQGELPESLEKLEIQSCGSLQKLPDLSSLTGLRMVVVNHCWKLNVEEISSLCSEKSIKFYEDSLTDLNLNLGNKREEFESETEGEDDEE
ncbi:disease resistance protein L6-like [Rhodamnia argentea]|uniref:Disease resistance protein L6-like n=1 Tax=Rhodamnia argentea TaxID=178133 RepID=A0ABM3HBC1_9MYRT|nr:disease resistance protein L6-like [Rhodamnia argentea]